MSDEAPHRFEFPVVRSTLSPERREAIGERFMQVAAAAAVNSTIGRRAPRTGRFRFRTTELEEARRRQVSAEAKRRIVTYNDQEQ